MVRSEESTVSTNAVVSQVKIQFNRLCEREGLDLIKVFGPYVDETIRALKTRGEAWEREEMPSRGKSLQFRT